MGITDGMRIFMQIAHLQNEIAEKGSPIEANNQGTLELINYSYNFRYENLIDIHSIREEMGKFYAAKGIDLNEIEKLEKDEYRKIETTLMEKSNYFYGDIHSRRVLWSDDCCISMIQFLIRNNTLLCYVHFRSSDVINKLFSDLYLIHKISRSLQEKFSLYNCYIHVTANSLHKIVINNVKEFKNGL